MWKTLSYCSWNYPKKVCVHILCRPNLTGQITFSACDWLNPWMQTHRSSCIPSCLWGIIVSHRPKKKKSVLKRKHQEFLYNSQLITLLTSVLLNPGYLINPPHLLLIFQDTVIYERLAETSKYKEITLKHLEQFATEGECYMNRTWLKHEEIMDFWYLVGSLAVPLPDFLDEVLVIDDSLDIPMH